MTTLQNKRSQTTIWPWDSTFLTIGLIILFGLIYSQAPLYTSNQNQYLLHGAARAGFGSLENDWLANTVDPTPIFSALVELTYLLRLPFLFHIYYMLLLGLYLYSIWSLLLETLRPDWSRFQQWSVLVLVIAIHSFAFRFALSRLAGQEWRFILEGGFAGQRLLGTVFQPSTFGVLLLFGILMYARNRNFTAVFCIALAATIHPTYLLSAALIIAGFMLDAAIRSRALRQPLYIGVVALVLVSPILLYTWSHFQPTSARLTEIASQILVEERIPNHILLEEWLDATVFFQSALVLTTIMIFRNRSLARIMGVIAAAVFLLTLFQIESGNQRLALLFPWRPSAILVPLANVLVIGYAADRLFKRGNSLIDTYRNSLLGLSLILLIMLAGLGAGSYLYDLRGKQLDPARPMFIYVRTNHVNGDRFFTLPKQQDFRLATGAPILVDFKSIPYVDTEVIEWHDRLRTAQHFYRDKVNQLDCAQIERANTLEAINHVVLGPDQYGLTCPSFGELIFSDDSYQVYKLKNEE
jgi:hypothetical protein